MIVDAAAVRPPSDTMVAARASKAALALEDEKTLLSVFCATIEKTLLSAGASGGRGAERHSEWMYSSDSA